MLIVGDTPDMVFLITTILQNEGASVRNEIGVEQALVAMREFRPHVVVADLEMPGRRGLAFAEGLREGLGGAEASYVPAVAVSALCGPGDARLSFAAGYQAHLAKPFQTVRFVLVVSHLAQRGQAAVLDGDEILDLPSIGLRVNDRFDQALKRRSN